MRRAAKPGFLLVARRETRWLLHDPVAIILIFGVPLFAFVVLSAVFSSPVIRGLGVVVVDEDRSETSRAFVEQVAASPGLDIVARAGDLATASRAIRSGDAIAAVYVPANFERDLKAERRPQVVAFYNQQFLTAAGVAAAGLSDSLAAASATSVAHAAPKASRIVAMARGGKSFTLSEDYKEQIAFAPPVRSAAPAKPSPVAASKPQTAAGRKNRELEGL